MRQGKIIPSASALPVPAECLCYRQGPCCWLHSHAKVAAHLVAQLEGISLSNLDGNKVTFGSRSQSEQASHGARCSDAGRTLGCGCQSVHLQLSGASVFAQALWQGALSLGSAPEPSPSLCGTAWATDVAALPSESNHPLGLVCCISPPHKVHCR